MASKGMKNLFGGLFGGKPKQEETIKKGPETATGIRQREKKMIARLEAIDLDDPQNQLSEQKLQELNVQGVINYALSELHYPLVIEHDIKNLDDNMDYIIRALEDAVKNGEEATAEWACTALVFAIKNLRTDVPGVDQDCADALMECRVEYSQNLRLLVELCRSQDALTANLADQRARRQEKRQELDAAKNRYQARRDSGALDLYLAELERNAHNPAALSDEALELRNELSNLHRLKASLIEVDTSINADQVSLNNRIAQIDSRRNALAKPPHVDDPKLQERINEANRLYRESLRRQLNEAEQGMRDYEVHIGAMTELANHSVHIMSVTQSLNMVKQMDLEKHQQLLAEQQAAEMRARAAENVATIEETIRLQREEQERILEQRRNVNIAYEPVVNTEVNVLTEFE